MDCFFTKLMKFVENYLRIYIVKPLYLSGIFCLTKGTSLQLNNAACKFYCKSSLITRGRGIKIDRRKGFTPEGTEALYREHAGKLVIEIKLNSVMQLFDSFDPAPFHEKELDPDAEEYIYNAVDEFPLKKPLEIMIHLPPAEVNPENENSLKKAIKNHFSYKKLLTEIELKRLLYQGRRNLLIALVFLFLCLLTIQLLSTFEESLIKTLFSEGLLIIGWVAMWEPIHIFLYGWWPIVHRRNIYQKIIDMDVSIGTGS